MKMRLRASLKLKQRKDRDLAAYAQTVVGSLTGNPHYPAAFPERDAMEAALFEYELALLEASQRTLGSTQAKNNARRRLHIALTHLSNACIRIANGNRAVFKSSGFDLRKRRRPVHLGRVIKFSVFHGKSEGVLFLKWQRVTKALLYLVQYTTTPEDESSWKLLGSPSRTKLRLDSLKLGQRYWFRVAAQGRRNQGPWSNIVSRIVA